MKLIVAVDERWGIGRDNGLLFSIPEDMAFFRSTTSGKVVVMGSSTLRSFPNGAPLKNRVNIVLSRNSRLEARGAVLCNSLEMLRHALASYSSDDVYVIGGETVYRQLLDYCDEALVTRIYADGAADRFFPNLDDAADWERTEMSEEKCHGDLRFRFCKYKNNAPRPF